MNADQIREQLIAAIRAILESSRVAAPEIGDDTCPLDIPGFDSQTWPYAMSELEAILGIDIPENVNIFLQKVPIGAKTRRLTICQIVDVLLKLQSGKQSK